MISHVYVASGEVIDRRLMKVGKANNPAKRGREIGLRIDGVCLLPDPFQAYRLEHDLRAFIRGLGATQYRDTYDWFLYDANIHKQALTLLADIASAKEYSPENIARMQQHVIDVREAIRRDTEAIFVFIAEKNAEIEQIKREADERVRRLMETLLPPLPPPIAYAERRAAGRPPSEG